MVVPTDGQIVEAVRAHLAQQQDASASSSASTSSINGGTKQIDAADLPRLLSTLELTNDWSQVSEKKFRSVLTNSQLLASVDDPAASGAVATNGTNASASGSGPSSSKKKKKSAAGIPRSYIDSSVPIPTGVRAVYFDSVKGKGLVADRDFKEGEVVFTEDAYIPTPPPEAMKQMGTGELCAHCFLPTSSGSRSLMVKPCPKCRHAFCSPNCFRSGMATHHILLCSGYNASAKHLVEAIEAQNWQSLHCVARSLARLLSTLTSQNNASNTAKNTKSGGSGEGEDHNSRFGSFEDVVQRLSSFATVSELERRARNPGWATEKAGFEQVLLQAHTALREALDPFYEPRAQARTAAGTGKSFEPHHVRMDLLESVKSRKSQIKDLFDYPTFLKLLGRANINMEKFGGLYSLHSFLNHSCEPNVQIRHVPERGILASMKIAALATKDIAKDDELVISYIDPTTALPRRQLVLYRDYCFGPCTCTKCTSQLKAIGLHYDPAKDNVKTFLDSVAKKSGIDANSSTDTSAGTKPNADNASLEDELRASLGF